MKRKDLYSISFGGMSMGDHEQSFNLTDEFFDLFPGSEIKSGNCKVEIAIKKCASFIELDFDITGEVIVECDRCLEDLKIPIETTSLLIVKFSSEIQDAEMEINDSVEDIIWLNPNDKELSLEQYMFDGISLSLPISRIHGENGNNESCDADMLNRFIIAE